MISSPAIRSIFKLVTGGAVSTLLTLGMLLAPVTCTCGAAVPHGHSLFQLSHHHHSADDDRNSHHTGIHESGSSLKPYPLKLSAPECDELDNLTHNSDNFVFSNAIEHQDSAVVKAPPSSSLGQPAAIVQPSLTETPSAQLCDSILMPGTRTMLGVATAPETPPPQV